MRYSRLFGKTVRQTPKDIKAPSHACLLQGGYIRPLGAGLFSLLPLGQRVFSRIKTLISEELGRWGGQEVLVPFVNPLEIWEKSGRNVFLGQTLTRFQGNGGREYVLAPTHEEAMVELVRSSIQSWKDLPIFLYQFQTKFRDENPRFGLVRTKEFLMKDGYSFHRSLSGLNNFFPKIFHAYMEIFRRCGLPDVISAEAGVGIMGGERAYEFLLPSPFGDDVVISCPSCGYRANREIAVGMKDISGENPAKMARVETPDCQTMEELSARLGLPRKKLLKPLVYRTNDGLVMAAVRADYEVSSEKLASVLNKPIFGLASKEELAAIGLIPGYLSPIGVAGKIAVVVDDAAAASSNLVYGSNEAGIHFVNVNFGRDFETLHVHDIAEIRASDRCLVCGKELEEIKAMELGNVFKLGDSYTRSMGLAVLTETGKKIHPFMGCYGIGIGRLMSAVAERHVDARGLRWPYSLSPFCAYLMAIGKSPSLRRFVEALASDLEEEVLYDDRNESAGVQFKDADLLGFPLRIVVSQKSLNDNTIEIFDRKTGRTWFTGRDMLLSFLKEYEKNEKAF